MNQVRSKLLASLLSLSTTLHCFADPKFESTSDEKVEVVSIEEQAWYEAADKAVAREYASPRNSRAEHISIADIIIPGGVKVVPHKHAWEEVYIVTSGRAQMMLEDEVREVKAGDSIVILPYEWHTIENLDPKEDLRLTVVCAPFWRPEGLVFDREAPNVPVEALQSE